MTSVMNKFAVVDFHSFKNDSSYVVKELSVVNVGDLTSRHFLFKPPGEDKDVKTSDWLTRNIHGLLWDAGDLEYSELRDVVTRNTFNSEYIYCKGEEKSVFL
uniref:Uncharacterized protein n=1 Tax=Clastoptera arizonana TaxID=38151 RepID=A0A1B6C339_9HEMI